MMTMPVENHRGSPEALEGVSEFGSRLNLHNSNREPALVRLVPGRRHSRQNVRDRIFRIEGVDDKHLLKCLDRKVQQFGTRR
jgi:hypothetical protein